MKCDKNNVQMNKLGVLYERKYIRSKWYVSGAKDYN